ncbi:MAG: prenyltransferase, partial [Anaerolineales bacterium]
SRDDLTVIYHLLKPPILLLVVLLYGLGAAIARYLGQPVLPDSTLLAVATVLSIQIAAQSLVMFFGQPGDRTESGRMLPVPQGEGLSSLSIRFPFFLAAAGLTVAATLTALLQLSDHLPLLSALILAGGTLLALAYSTPPFSLQTTGYGELTLSLLLGAAIPAFAYAQSTGEIHRLLVLSSVPLAGVIFAVQIALSLAKYGEHIQAEHKNLLVRLGWQRAMRVHDVALILSFLVLGLAFSFGLPRRVTLGTFMVLPLAVIQIWYFNRIRAGAPVRWRLLSMNSYAMVGLMTYLELAGYLLS